MVETVFFMGTICLFKTNRHVKICHSRWECEARGMHGNTVLKMNKKVPAASFLISQLSPPVMPLFLLFLLLERLVVDVLDGHGKFGLLGPERKRMRSETERGLTRRMSDGRMGRPT